MGVEGVVTRRRGEERRRRGENKDFDLKHRKNAQVADGPNR